MKLLITGASGFIGTSLLHQIPDNCQLLCISRRPVNSLNHLEKENISFLQASLSDLSSVVEQIRRFKPSVCLHLAWEGLPDYSYTACSRNFLAFQHLLSVLIQAEVPKIVVTGSCLEIPPRNNSTEPFLYDSPDIPLFGQYKNMHIRLLQSLSNESIIDFAWARLFYTFGPLQRKSSLIPMIIRGFIHQSPVIPRTIHKHHDFIFVDDATSALVAIARNPSATGIFNIGSGKLTNVGAIYNQIHSLMEQDLSTKIDMSSIMDEENNLPADISKTVASLQWRPRYDIISGLSRTIQMYRS